MVIELELNGVIIRLGDNFGANFAKPLNMDATSITRSVLGKTYQRVIAGLDPASRVYPTCSAYPSSELGQARVLMQSTMSLSKVGLT